MVKQKAVIEGMKCEGCAETVESKLSSLEGVSRVLIDLDEKTAVIQSDKNYSADELTHTLKDTPYTVEKVEEA